MHTLLVHRGLEPEPIMNSPTGESSAIVLACIINPRKSVFEVPPESITVYVIIHQIIQN